MNQRATVTPTTGRVLQRKCACGAGESCEACGKKKELQRKATGPTTGEVPDVVYDVLRSPGQPLDAATRAFMEPRFGHDFSRVRVHTDAQAAESAAAVHAHAYTVGNDIAFAEGRFAPTAPHGRSLIAHELTHVVQQAATADTVGALEIGADSSPFEVEARAAGEGLSHSVTRPNPATSGLQLMRFSELTEAQIEKIVAKQFPAQLAKTETKIAARSAVRAAFRKLFWRKFWGFIVKRFALRGGIAVALSAADGPLPIGELISLGLMLYTAYEVIEVWEELEMQAQKAAVDELGTPTEVAEEPEPAEQPEKTKSKEKRKPKECRKEPSPNPLPISWPTQLPHPVEMHRYLVRTPAEVREWEGIERGAAQAAMRRQIVEHREQLIPPPQACFESDAEPNAPYDAHHIHPLYIGGEDDLYNLCAVETGRHMRGHRRLDDQTPHLPIYMEEGVCSPFLSQHAAGQTYEIVGSK